MLPVARLEMSSTNERVSKELNNVALAGWLVAGGELVRAQPVAQW